MILIFLAMFVPLLLIGGLFAMMANSSSRKGQSGSLTGSSNAKQGRADDEDL